MRRCCRLLFLAWAAWAWPQTVEPPEILRARDEVSRVKTLVEAGALPASRLQQAREALEEAQDSAALRRTLYGSVSAQDLTEQDVEEMIAAARRLAERQDAKVEKARKVVEEGAASRMSLAPLLEEQQHRNEMLELALSRGRLVRELAAMARAEVALQDELSRSLREPLSVAERYDGSGAFDIDQLDSISRAFTERFDNPLPVSARGDTAVHRAMGFDHRGRVDVALDPDQPEGVWLRRYLESAGIPYFAFRASVPGKSTAPHIHIGSPSARIHGGG